MHTLYVILGDQLDPDTSLLRKLDPKHDIVWMAEVVEEATEHPSPVAMNDA